MPAPPFTIRRLGPDDLDLMRGLNRMFGRAFADEDHYGAAPPCDAYLSSALARDDKAVLVALEGEEVVGGLVAYELDKLERERREWYLYDLAVREDRRRARVATALIDRLRDLARDRGACVIFVQADHGDEPAISLYGKFGTREDVLHFDIVPSRPVGPRTSS